MISMACSTLILNKRPSKFQIIGIVITFIGVSITVVAAGLSASFSAVGYLFLTIAVIAYALYGVYVEKATGYTDAEITYVMLAFGAVVFTTIAIVKALIAGNLVYLLTLPFNNTSLLIAVLYQSIGCSILAFLLANTAIANIGVNRAYSFLGISTIVSILAGALVLGESVTPMQLVGAAVIVAGIYIANVVKARK